MGSPATTLRVREILTGPDRILEFTPHLAPLLTSCGLLADFEDLAFLLRVPPERQPTRRTPLLLVFEHTAPPHALAGAVLLFRHNGLLGPFHLITTIDRTGRRSLFAPATLRPELAALAAETMLRRGATLVNLDFQLADPQSTDAANLAMLAAEHIVARTLRTSGSGRQFALQRKSRALFLPVVPGFDATLAALGRRTRKNLRNYRRLLEKEQGCTFHPHAQVDLESFLALNQASAYTVSDRMARFRFHALQQTPGLFLAGIRNGDGDWIALACGRRKADSLDLHWQFNRRDLARYSLSLVMRGCILQHASETGIARVHIEGHTRSPISESFREGLVYNLALRRRTFRLGLLELLFRLNPDRPALINLIRTGRRWKQG